MTFPSHYFIHAWERPGVQFPAPPKLLFFSHFWNLYTSRSTHYAHGYDLEERNRALKVSVVDIVLSARPRSTCGKSRSDAHIPYLGGSSTIHASQCGRRPLTGLGTSRNGLALQNMEDTFKYLTCDRTLFFFKEQIYYSQIICLFPDTPFALPSMTAAAFPSIIL